MSSLNKRVVTAKIPPALAPMGGPVPKTPLDKERVLRKLVLANMLWEDQFYANGVEISEALTNAIGDVHPALAASVAKEARNEFKLRHVPLFIMRELARNGTLEAHQLNDVIQRPDELGEFLSIYWKDKKQPLSNQVKKGLAMALTKFDEYSLAKWNKNSANVSIRDVLFLTHAKPVNKEQEEIFKRLANNQLTTPDTWEVNLSAGADKKETFTRLMEQNKLGALAFLRNLRNMVEAEVSTDLIRAYSVIVDVSKVLPFRFIAAARIVPQFEDMLETMMFRALKSHPKLSGKTLLMVDVSGSMFGAKISNKSDLDRFDAAAALAVLCREICETVDIFTFSDYSKQVAPRRGFALVDALFKNQQHSGTYLEASLHSIKNKYDRCIVFTDEMSYDTVTTKLANKNYLINVSSYQNGIEDKDWLSISGFSEAVIDYIQAIENM